MSEKLSITNKEAIQRLKAYFLSQDPETVAYLASSLLIDIGRFMRWDKLGQEEQASLLARSQANNQNTIRFLREGSSELLKVFKVNSDE